MQVLELLNPDLRILMCIPFGSQLYGTANANSDQDYKGVYLPTRRQVLLNNAPKHWSYNTSADNIEKNTAEDLEIQIFSLHYFIELVTKGEMIALDMLHATENFCTTGEWDIWGIIRDNRAHAYTKSIKGWLQYARKQAAKYGIKGSRINVLDTLLYIFGGQNESARLGDILEQVPNLQYCDKQIGETNLETKFFVDGRTFIGTTPVKIFLDFLVKHRASYGARAELAAQNLGVDWKAVSHAFRAFYQFKHILQEGDFTYPLPEADYLKQIKQGELDFTTIVLPALDKLADEVELLAHESKLPDTLDKDFWDDLLIGIIERYVL